MSRVFFLYLLRLRSITFYGFYLLENLHFVWNEMKLHTLNMDKMMEVFFDDFHFIILFIEYKLIGIWFDWSAVSATSLSSTSKWQAMPKWIHLDAQQKYLRNMLQSVYRLFQSFLSNAVRCVSMRYSVFRYFFMCFLSCALPCVSIRCILKQAWLQRLNVNKHKYTCIQTRPHTKNYM